MNRVSTAGNYATALANLMSAQGRQIAAGQQVSSQKKATDFKGYARNAETLTAMRTLQVRITGYIDQTTNLGNKLQVQDTSLNQITDAVQKARQAIADALASDRGDTLMQQLSGEFDNVTEGVNAKFDGQYLFSGGQVNTRPTTAGGLASLTAAPSIASLFQNGAYVTSNRLDDSTSLQTGFLGDQVATEAFTAFANVESFEQGAGGPFGGTLTQAQRTFLQGQLQVFDQAHANLTNIVGQNGLMQNRVTSAQTDLGGRRDMLEQMMGSLTDVDMAGAVSQLQQAQLSVQAAAQVFSTLQGASLLNYLR